MVWVDEICSRERSLKEILVTSWVNQQESSEANQAKQTNLESQNLLIGRFLKKEKRPEQS